MKRFKLEMMASGVLREYKHKQHFESAQAKRRRRDASNATRARKVEAATRERMGLPSK